jgi:hypothetical protein
MRMLRGLLHENADRIALRWFEEALSDYSADAQAALSRQRDRFANPLAHGLRVGTRALFEVLVDGADEAALRASLEEIVKVRAVQEMPPSRALAFVFRLKGLIRASLGEALDDPLLRTELEELDGRIDRAALTAFDLFVESRERVMELRIEEVKRNTPWFVGRMGQSGVEPELR